ncbi:crotonase/enoyl-CoA hydratase family protein [Rhodococcus sp. IEGM 1305]|uniref:crotonase/enoyl-CoA hydratase family protein n=1 Tax=Rhodococcus sp. IEGM 1305 TaxID=3047092 RepID=UPI0024B6E243|nr:crotonase/enoyl-CoA hydratase family protein [Rhodococcus sp. IEGM 1305]MDI9953279.1 crotonase/enoyl-CoA hydratase family protein [Rhodococcus sp. IEGM 1305]
MSAGVLVERRESVQVITINRPEVRNAIDESVAHAVAAAVDELDADDDLRVAVITGAGGCFSSGMDLAAWQRGEWPVVGDRGLCGITKSAPRKPVIAAVEGWALAGGFELMLACDLVVAGTTAKFGLPEVQLSLVAGGGGALLLPRRIPYAVAMEMLLTGDPIGGERAAALGLITRAVPDGEAFQAALRLADRIARNGPLAVAATKRIAGASASWTYADGWSEQDSAWEPVMAAEDAREGVRSFLERRAPQWTGR